MFESAYVQNSIGIFCHKLSVVNYHTFCVKVKKLHEQTLNPIYISDGSVNILV